MVVICEITDRFIRVINGSWGIGADGSWVFIPDLCNAVRRLSILEGGKLDVVREAVREAYGLGYVDSELHLSFQWPDWMDIEAGYGERTRPVPVKTDETMAIFLAMRFELEDLCLYVSKVCIDGCANTGLNSSTTSLGLLDKGKDSVQCPEAPSSDYEFTQFQKLMEDDAVQRWMRSTQPSAGYTGDSSSNVPLSGNDPKGPLEFNAEITATDSTAEVLIYVLIKCV